MDENLVALVVSDPGRGSSKPKRGATALINIDLN